ncbi:hypothetical protein TIFTF001_009924 [Ficus carica]|uniref:Uncharacterized protein n=1 Tax=Ficus carica TaxID=3494 RepID=A0AA87ZP23_FICCA|nr:hypothetical protein TIFTF001_009924 [Ficus carica]
MTIFIKTKKKRVQDYENNYYGNLSDSAAGRPAHDKIERETGQVRSRERKRERSSRRRLPNRRRRRGQAGISSVAHGDRRRRKTSPSLAATVAAHPWGSTSGRGGGKKPFWRSSRISPELMTKLPEPMAKMQCRHH